MKLIPFSIQLITFFLWSNLILPTKSSEGGFDDENQIFVGILLVTGLYFLLLETIQLINKPKAYFNLVKLIDSVGATLIIYNSLYSVIYNDSFTVRFWRI